MPKDPKQNLVVVPKLAEALTKYGAQLPDDILADLRDAFDFYDKKKEGYISM